MSTSSPNGEFFEFSAFSVSLEPTDGRFRLSLHWNGQPNQVFIIYSAPNQDSCSICKMNGKTAMSITKHTVPRCICAQTIIYSFQEKKHRTTFCAGAGLLGTLGAWVDVNIPMDHEKCIERCECFQPSIQQIINWIHKVNITMTSLFQNSKGANKDKLNICKLFQSAWLFLLNKSSFTIVHSLLHKSDAILGAIFPNGICKHPSTSVCSVLVANLPSGTCLKWWNNPIDPSGVWNTQWTGLKLNLLSWTEGHAHNFDKTTTNVKINWGQACNPWRHESICCFLIWNTTLVVARSVFMEGNLPTASGESQWQAAGQSVKRTFAPSEKIYWIHPLSMAAN